MTARLMTDDELDAVQAGAVVAIETGVIVVLPMVGLVVVPDTVMIEGIANGQDVSGGVRFACDGRTVAVYAMPEVLL